MSDAPSSGEVAGIMAAGGAILLTVGRGIKWIAGYLERRSESRATKLQAWHDELTKRETAFDAKVEERLKTLERQGQLREAENMALRLAFELVASALRTIDPNNTALSRAEQMLQAAFPLTAILPPDMTTSLQAIRMEVQ